MTEPDGTAHRTGSVKEAFSQVISVLRSIPARSTEAVEDSRERFLLWAGNVGALHRPEATLSLEHRLRDLPEALEQIWMYLGELRETLGELRDLISDSSPVRRGYDPKHYLEERKQDDVEGDDASGESDGECEQELLDIISEYLSALFRIAVIIRTATARDRYDRALQYSNADFLDHFDIDYVRTRYPKLNGHHVLAQGLGRAITNRRKFIAYSRDHGDRLHADGSRKMEPHLETLKQKQKEKDPALDTTSRSGALPERDRADAFTGKESSKETTLLPAKVNMNNLAVTTEEENDNVSFVSASTSFNTEGSVLTLPSLEDISQGKPEFECPICRTIQRLPARKIVMGLFSQTAVHGFNTSYNTASTMAAPYATQGHIRRGKSLGNIW
ncbi:hypothetical protein DL766_007393 [Monosporascus sp. MC13-8B]|uniref:Prion-inhibition and propagation HeLo domain-containing protein n=1 Tax=Monosporascus cannonballus TaxID=155416 RepID=A0ABY0HE32_9PEZI|nr:hypothetical protein DL763_008235 [Monosporascus cannonballus]RYO90450.1 hypothetical protein DL762_002654 [Monosporascus cannonballus]RYP23995.1 hypothetical protein DL766_007393 [Monosporascus sp. MC13-8B]